MDVGAYRFDQELKVPRPPNVFFDGTRLGLEGTMLSTIIVAVGAGLHIGLSSTLGYVVRYADGLPAEAKAFSVFGFIFLSLLAAVALAMLFFFGTSIPTMAYSMGLVYFMLRWVGKRRGREKLVSAIVGAVLGLIVGVLWAAVVSLLIDLQFSGATYATLFRWPAILSIDGIALLWLTLYPLTSAGAGFQIGWRLGKQIEELTLYWYW